MKKTLVSAAAAAAVLFMAAPVFAQATDTANVTISATVAAKAKLTLGSNTVSFADANPDVTPSITATALSVDVKARTTAAGSVTLTVLSGGDLVSGSDNIAISNLTWTVAGSGMVAGTMNKTTAQSLGSWTGSGNRTGMSQTYALANSWSYAVGSYGATVTYTLTAP
jgi:hypothetical protein